ncbi:MAG: hypothetical protein H7A09_09600 [Oceanospirillaceae bacterium]|nr:hypothetical protein [Oceanospirillaceae bacterium]MCP5350682.1 hypothetical protein [Oceanospirillaceae bacterium]
MNYRQWHIPLEQSGLILEQGLESLKALGAPQEDIPLIVKLLENPHYSLPGLTLFHGAVDLHQHDVIHLLLGRGLLPKDEAFTIGFTMGTTHAVTALEESLFCTLNQLFYPSVYRFGDEEVRVFRDALALGHMSACKPLNEVDFTQFYTHSLGDIRAALGLESDLLRAYYRIEKQRYPHARESQRLGPVNTE